MNVVGDFKSLCRRVLGCEGELGGIKKTEDMKNAVDSVKVSYEEGYGSVTKDVVV